MKIFLDTADIAEIEKANQTGLLSGVTTNPTLIRRSGRNPVRIITEISEAFPNLESISAEVVGGSADEMLDQAGAYQELSNVTIKVPCTVDGLIACNELAKNKSKVNVTLVFSLSQALLAKNAGAAYVSPFVGRMADNDLDGIGLIKDIRKAYSGDGRSTTTQILGASIRDVSNVEQCALAGVDVVTIPPEVFWEMYNHFLTDSGLEKFNDDWNILTRQMQQSIIVE
jgi:TalC/MipB family fructose-6-phosphate aldolase